MTTKPIKTPMLPYRRQGEIDYASLDFDPDVTEPPPDAMEQNRELNEIHNLLIAHITGFDSRPDIFLDRETNICYYPPDLNVRIVPDLYLAFGVDAQAIRPRKLYLPWEVGKPPDWVLEVASASTGRADVNRKPGIYAQIGVPEYWRFDPTGGRYHGEPLTGLILEGGRYQPVELTTEPDGVLKGYSPVLGFSLCWDQGWPRLYNPATGAYLENWREAAARAQAAEAQRDAEALARAEAEAEVQRLREELRRNTDQE